MWPSHHTVPSDILRGAIDDLTRTVQACGPGEGVLLLVTGPRGSGRSSVLRELLLSLPGWAGAHTQALPWQQRTPGLLLSHAAARLSIEGPLSTTLDTESTSTIIAVDDVQWADTQSIQELVTLTRRSLHGRVAVICSVPEGAAGESVDLVRGLSDGTCALAPLDIREVRSFALALSGTRLSPSAAAQLQEITGGRPGLIEEVLDSVPGDHWRNDSPTVPVPDAWRTAMEEKLAGAEGLGAQVLPVLQAVALVSDGISTDLLRALTGDDGTGIDAVVELGFCRAQSEPGSTRLQLINPSDRAALVSMTPPGYRSAMHRAAAVYFTERGDEDQAVWHKATSLSSPDPALAAHIAARGHELGATGHWRRAARHMTLAAEVAGDDESAQKYRLDAVESMIGASDIPMARMHTRSLPLHLRGTTSAIQKHSILGYLALHEGRRLESTHHVDKATAYLASHGPEGDDSVPRGLASRIASRQALLNLAEWKPEEVLVWMHRADAWAVEGGSARTESRAIALIAQGAVTGRMPAEPPADHTSGLHVQRQDMAMGWLSLVFDDPVTARQRLQRRTNEDGSERISLWQDAWLARANFVMGEWKDAMIAVERGLARAERFGIRFLEPLLLWTGAQISVFRGDMALATSYTNRLTISSDSFSVQIIPSAMCRLLFGGLTNDLPSSIRAGEKLTALQEQTDLSQPGFWPWEDVWAQTLLRANRIAEAEEVTSIAEERATESGLLSLTAKLGVPRGNLLIMHGDIDAGVKVLDESVEAIDSLPMPAYQSRIFFEYGQLLRRLGQRRRADDLFARAGEVFAAMGATTFVERCNRERRAGGLGPRTLDATGLTPQEKEIAEAVASGATNREVATELFLSSKTVEYHLTRVYRKLGIRSRAELPRALEHHN